MIAILAGKFAPGFSDYYLAMTGYSSQQTDGDESPDRPSNLWHPVKGAYAAHGPFDERARKHSLQLWAGTHKSTLALAGILAMGVFAMFAGGRRASLLIRPVVPSRKILRQTSGKILKLAGRS